MFIDNSSSNQPTFSSGTFLPAGRENGYGQISAGDQYDFKSYQYPITLGEKADPHYMVFYINIDSQSKYIGRSSVLGDAPSIEQNRISTGVNQSVAVKAGKKVRDLMDEYFGGAGTGILNMISGAENAMRATEFGKETMDAVSGQFSKTTKRISRAIVLPVPANLSSDYGINWESESLGVSAGFLDNASKTQAQEQFSETGKILGTILGRSAVRAGAAIINNPLSQSIMGDKVLDGKAVTEKLTRSVINPRKEQLFKNVGFRKFNFQWTLVPKSQKEAEAIQNIIREFKFHMHPEMTAGGFFYVYPSEFDMKFYFSGVENTALSKISTCVLTDLKINYTPNNEFVTYKDGMPDAIQLTLAFTELELLTKERIEKGF